MTDREALLRECLKSIRAAQQHIAHALKCEGAQSVLQRISVHLDKAHHEIMIELEE